MNARTAETLFTKYPLGNLFIEGKTKRGFEVRGNPDLVVFVSKDNITAGDGAKHDVIRDKGKLANETTCNVFRLLKECGLPVAFEEQRSKTSFVAPRCAMLPYEVVVRREAHGSYLKRNPHILKGQLFPQLLVEFFLKTSGRRWKEHELICDDPYIVRAEETSEIRLFNPAKPIHGQEPFLVLPEEEVFSHNEGNLFQEMRRIARWALLILEKAWQIESRTLVDFKVEFGLTEKGTLLLADVIDNDSWRVLESGAYIDKQVYRDGGTLDNVVEKYQRVAELTSRFRVPRQQIIIWRGSEKDNVDALLESLKAAVSENMVITIITCSVHKEPVKAVHILNRLVQEVPNSVVIAFIGRSNGAGPTLSAATTVPVITIPTSVKEFPDDIWSSLRTPGNVPVMTVLEPVNAALAALNILAAHNPQIYALVRGAIEERMVNTILI